MRRVLTGTEQYIWYLDYLMLMTCVRTTEPDPAVQKYLSKNPAALLTVRLTPSIHFTGGKLLKRYFAVGSRSLPTVITQLHYTGGALTDYTTEQSDPGE